MNPRAQLIANVVLLQVAVVGPMLLGAVDQRAIAVAPWLACALQLGAGPDRKRDAKAMLVAGGLGTAAEWLCAFAGLLSFGEAPAIGGMPLWVTPQWAMLGVSLHYALRGLAGRAMLGTAVGAGATALSLRGAQTAGLLAVSDTPAWIAAAVGLGGVVGLLAKTTARRDPPASSAGPH